VCSGYGSEFEEEEEHDVEIGFFFYYKFIFNYVCFVFVRHSASGTSGGSSGSPVLNKKGVAVAINAGGKAGTSAGFFLPLDRPKRALALLQAGLPVTRGSLQAVCRQVSKVSCAPK